MNNIEEFIQNFLDGFIGFASVLDTQGKVLHVNQAALDKADLELSEVKDKFIWETYWWNYDQEVSFIVKNLCQKAAKGEDIHQNMIARIGEKSTLPVAVRICPIKNDKGEITHLFPSAVDLSEQVEANSNFEGLKHLLGQKAIEFKDMADNIPQLAWMAEPDGNIFWFNQRLLDYTGKKTEELLGTKWRDLHHPDHVERVIANYQRSFLEDDKWEDKFPLKRHDGAYRWFLSMAYPIKNESGDIIRWFGTNTDITQEREIMELKDKFLSIIGHELRNPLAALQSGLDLFSTGTISQDEGAEIFRMMGDQTAHLKTLIDRVLEVSRFATGKIQLTKERRSINELVDQVMTYFTKKAETLGLTLEYRPCDEGLVCSVDVKQFSRLMHIVLENSIKYSKHAGRISVSLERKERDAQIIIKDNGQGIAPKNLDRIFEVFFQEGDKLSGVSEGLGISLHVAKELCEMHNAKIWAESEGKNKGSVFYISLPLDKVKNNNPNNSKGHHSKKILLVEDNEDLGRMMQLKLEALGHTVFKAVNGLDAVNYAEKYCPEVILMDIGMPGMNGYEAAKSIKENEWSSKMRIIALTGWGQEEDRRRSKEAGFDEHLVKPVSLSKLLEALDRG